MIRRLIADNKWLLLLLYFPVYLAAFFTIDKIEADHHVIVCALDEAVRFNELFVIPYALWFFWFPGVLLLFAAAALRPYFKGGASEKEISDGAYFIRSREDSNADQYSHVQHFPKRYLVSVRIRDNEDRESYHIRLTEIRNKPYMQDLPYMRQYSLLLDYNDLINMQFRPLRLGMFIKDFSADMALDQRIANNVMEIPEGDYFCFRSRILSDGWNPYLAKMFFSDSIRKPGLVLANEYEDSLTEYHNCPYEVQILITDGGNSRMVSDD